MCVDLIGGGFDGSLLALNLTAFLAVHETCINAQDIDIA